jgi:hypothetical protein
VILASKLCSTKHMLPVSSSLFQPVWLHSHGAMALAKPGWLVSSGSPPSLSYLSTNRKHVPPVPCVAVRVPLTSWTHPS